MTRVCTTILCLILVNALCAQEIESPGLHKDVPFAKSGDTALALDAYVPEGSGPFPTCILVHGGGFTKGTKQSYITPTFDPLSKASFTWFTIDYRLAPNDRWPACADDVVAAVRWVKEHARQYKVDVDRIALIGESAGGHLVSYVGTQNQKLKLGLAAVVPFYAPHDLEMQVHHRGMLGESLSALLDLTELNDAARQKLKAASPASYLQPGMPPFLLIHGTKDEQVPYEQSVEFQKSMLKSNNACELITIADGAHGMGGWEKLGSDYREQMIAWLQRTLTPFPGKRSTWNGFRRSDFEVDRRPVLVVAPNTAAPGRPWIWHGEFFGHKPEPDIALLKRGFHIAYMQVPDMLGSPKAVEHWNKFYAELTGKHGLAHKPGLVGLSRGGLYCYNWAAANPDKVACIYGDAPVCDFKSWPGGKGKGKGSPRDWKLVLEQYGLADEAAALAYDKNPVDNLKPLAKAKVPLLHVYGDADDVVPWDENTGLIAERYPKIGGEITLIPKKGVGHHPHGLDDPTPIVEFLATYAGAVSTRAVSSEQ